MTIKTIAIICARGGSKGLRDKNLKPLCGTPLIGRAISHALAAKSVDTVICSTDDERIAQVARDYGAIVPFIRPSELSDDLATTESTLRHALLTYEGLTSANFDICVFLTATDIFRDEKWIDTAVEKLIENEELESVFVGCKTHKNYWQLTEGGRWERVQSWMAEYSSRQVRRFIVREDTGLACASRAWLWREGKRIGDVVDIIVTDDDFTAIDIHTSEDLRLAEAALEIRGGE
jgi:CMP-N,N'-diacetyllegionaminic acid synthase